MKSHELNFFKKLKTYSKLKYSFFFCIVFTLILSFQFQGKEKGKASYYANKFEGKRTSSGEIFRQDSLTCAHKTLKFGTFISITNLANDSTVIVKVNDRLSKKSARIVDVSLKAAKQLNFVKQGIATVVIQTIN
jgi:rare lipoprotein A